MINRCTNPNADQWRHYGGRGITVCERWRWSLYAFAEDLPPRPGPGYTLDRIDVNGNYEPGNVRWATHSEQMQNKRERTHCTRGHEFTAENTIHAVIRGKPARNCRECKNTRRKARRARLRAAGLTWREYN